MHWAYVEAQTNFVVGLLHFSRHGVVNQMDRFWTPETGFNSGF